MKKQYLFFFIIFLGYSLLQAQTKWTKGATLSFGLSGEREQEIEEFNTQTLKVDKKLMPSYGAGLWIERSLGQHFGVELGLGYSYLEHFKRHKNEIYFNLGRMTSMIQSDEKYKAHQLHAPLQLHYFFNKKDKNLRPFLSIGGNVSYFLLVTKSEQKKSIRSGTITYSNKEKYKPNNFNTLINHHPISYFLGFGFDFGAFRFEINRTQYALKENKVREVGLDIELCQCDPQFPPPYDNIPSIHTTLIKLKYKL